MPQPHPSPLGREAPAETEEVIASGRKTVLRQDRMISRRTKDILTELPNNPLLTKNL